VFSGGSTGLTSSLGGTEAKEVLGGSGTSVVLETTTVSGTVLSSSSPSEDDLHCFKSVFLPQAESLGTAEGTGPLGTTGMEVEKDLGTFEGESFFGGEGFFGEDLGVAEGLGTFKDDVGFSKDLEATKEGSGALESAEAGPEACKRDANRETSKGGSELSSTEGSRALEGPEAQAFLVPSEAGHTNLVEAFLISTGEISTMGE
ncbi:hypothetical protein FT663_05524, partial [Candidozyma haemuli var. vulneris]